jgi:hypothetical protein
MKRFIPLLCLCIIVGALLACGESNTGTKSNSTNATSGQDKPAAPAQHFKVGETVKVGDVWQVVINSVKTDDGGQYSALKSGNVYLIADISLNNLSDKEQNTSSIMNWTLQGPDGQKYSQSIDPNAGASLDGKVAAGSPLKGVIAFEVPASVHSYELHFSPDIVSAGQTTWDLSV